MSNCKECRYYNDVTGICYELDKEVVNADAGYCIAHETSEAYDLGFDKGYDIGYDKGFAEGCDKAAREDFKGYDKGFEDGLRLAKEIVRGVNNGIL